ncbi:efflux RND transporter permease subunit [Gallaecimonas xiamenensis]|uniref:Acriflavin resistance protein n=1 Tax=Gallaecimonas xiamenensis 3-C-1 TaxID=745411 RepID=K2IPY6_9GAMM|nr:efflux RND transporter permease subunit [Gallaecimonas xiamenensis]EKE72161.1 acriflavin resistance protein [Gallaecimonas xiamenensis 3-C-1]
MNIATWSINNRVVTLVLTLVMLVAGLLVYNKMSRLEDPEFTIKDALVITPYGGASAQEVEQEVTEKLEKAVQQLGELHRVTSKSERGLSTLTVTIKDSYGKDSLPQVWDKLRSKIRDAQGQLPPGAGPSMVLDDYGDVYSIFMVVTGDGFSYAELKGYVDALQKELLLVKDVGKVSTFGERQEALFVEFNRDRLSQLGIAPASLLDALNQKGLAADAGRARVGDAFVTLTPSGALQSVADVASLLVSGSDGRQFLLRDVATVRRGYVEPSSAEIRFDGKSGIGLGIATQPGGNVVTMGQAVMARLHELESERPLGIEFGMVSLQSEAVTQAIAGFVSSLVEAVVIVVAVLLLFMGMRSGLLIGFVLVLTIAGSFLFLDPMGVALERVSLGALIIALGMLVDNAIVVVDGVLVRMQKGESAEQAAATVVKQSAWPLLGATLIAILAFAAIGTSNDDTGEYCRSLFQVVMVSLLLSWVTAVTVTPLLCVMFLKAPKGDAGDPYQGAFYQGYRGLLRRCIRHRYLSCATVGGLFAIAVWGFSFVEQSFFPSATRPQFMVDYWLPQGTHIDKTREDAGQIEQYLLAQPGVTHVSSTLGEGPLRFLLTFQPQQPNSAYGQFLVSVDDHQKIAGLLPKVEEDLTRRFPDALVFASPFELGTGVSGKVQARLSGPDSHELRRLADQVQDIFQQDPDAKAVRSDWRQKVKVVRANLAEEQANLNGITRPMVAQAMQEGFQGVTAGIYREQDLLLPIMVRADQHARHNIDSLANLQIWSPVAQQMIPLRQVVPSFDTVFEDELILRRDRKPTITVLADPKTGSASALLARVKPQVEAIALPAGYSLAWGGEYEAAQKAEAGLAGTIPTFVVAMILITIMMFNSLRQPLVIWLCVPLAVIGVTAGLLATGQPFGFMALLGFLSLMGMLIKNAIVLVDQINLEQQEGKGLYNAILDSGVSRLRPVAMAALTTALGMIPLIFDVFFASMATTIIGGLLFATLLTMVVLPVFYAIAYQAPVEEGGHGAKG